MNSTGFANHRSHTGHWWYWLHRLKLAFHARDPKEMVHPRAYCLGVAYWLLEPHRSPWLHAMRRLWVCFKQRGIRDCSDMVHFCWLLGLSRKSNSFPIYSWVHCLAISPPSEGTICVYLAVLIQQMDEAKKGLEIVPRRQSDPCPDGLQDASKLSSLKRLDELLRMGN